MVFFQAGLFASGSAAKIIYDFMSNRLECSLLSIFINGTNGNFAGCKQNIEEARMGLAWMTVMWARLQVQTPWITPAWLSYMHAIEAGTDCLEKCLGKYYPEEPLSCSAYWEQWRKLEQE